MRDPTTTGTPGGPAAAPIVAGFDGSGPAIGGGRYRIGRTLGSGGMGVVYEAWDEERGCAVALKTLRRVAPAAVYRFKREFRSLATTRHPNLVALYDLVAEGDRVFFTMERVVGQDFLRYIGHPTWPGAGTLTGGPSSVRSPPPVSPVESTLSGLDTAPARHPLSVRTSLPARLGFGAAHLAALDCDRLRSALRQLTEALDALHAQGCLHRDVKPSNVLVTEEGRLVLLDLGLVTWTHPSEASVERYVAGTAAYMSPEQGAAKALDDASDRYSMGVMLYEALIGTRPFRGTFDQIIAAKQVARPPRPSSVVDGVPPDLDALCMDLLAFEPGERPVAAEILRRLKPASVPPRGRREPAPPPPPLGLRPAFVGREEPLDVLRRAWQRSARGETVSLHLHGPPGVGKSALLRAFLDEAAGEAVLLTGRCYEHESVPFKAIDGLIDSLSGHLRGLDRVEVERLLPPDIGPLAQVFPVLRQVEPIALLSRAPEAVDPRELRRRAVASLRALLHRVALRSPLALCIDDLQWGDADSAQILAELVRGPDPPPMLLVVAYRADDRDASEHIKALRVAHGLTAPQEGDDAPAIDLAVGGLSRAESTALARELLGDDAEARRQASAIAAEAQGNPYFVHELVRFVQREGEGAELHRPEGSSDARFLRRVRLEDLLRRRLEELEPDPRALLVTLAVAGRPLPRSLAAQAAGLTRGDLDAIDVLQGAHLLRTRESRDGLLLEPYHDRIREAIVEDLRPSAARERHLRLAVALEGSRCGDPEALAEHFAGAGHLEQAGAHALDAAEQAAGVLAFERSAMLYRFALRLLPSEQVRARGVRPALAEALAQAGRAREAAEVFAEAVEESEGSDRLQHQLRCGEEYLRSGRVVEGLGALGEVLSQLGMALPRTPAGAVFSLLLRRLRLTLRGLRWSPRAPEALAPLRAARIDACWTVASGLGMIDPVRGADYQTRNLLLSLRSGDAPRVARSLAMEAMYRSASGARGRRRAGRVLQDAAAVAERLGDPRLRGLCSFAAGVVAYEGGEWSRARDLLSRADATFLRASSGVTLEVTTNRHFLLLSLLQLGELKDLGARLPAYIADAEDRGDRFTATSFRNGCMNIAWLASGGAGAARAEIEQAMAPWAPEPFYLQHYEGLYARTTADLYAGDGAAAWARIQERWGRLRASQLLSVQQLRLEALYLRGRAALAASSGGGGPLRPAIRAARAIERSRMAWARPLAGILRAGVAARRGDRAGAADRLGAAIASLDLQEMQGYAAAARWRRGTLIGGREGEDTMAGAAGWFESQGVSDPEAMARVFAP